MADKYLVQLSGSFDYTEVTKGIQEIKKQISSIHLGDEIAKDLKKSLEKIEIDLPGLEKLSKQTELSNKEAEKYSKLIEKITKEIIAFNTEVEKTDFKSTLSKIDTSKLEELDKKILEVENRIKEAKRVLAEGFIKSEFNGNKSAALNNAITQLFDVKPEEVRNKFSQIETTITAQVDESITKVEQVLQSKTKAKDFSSGKRIIEAFFGEDSGVELATKVDVLKEKFNEIVGEYRNFSAGSEEAKQKAKELLDLLNNPEYFKNEKSATPFGLPTQQDLNLLSQLEDRITKIEEILKEKKPIIEEDESKRLALVEQRVSALEIALKELTESKEKTQKVGKQLVDTLEEEGNQLDRDRGKAEKYNRQHQALQNTFGGLIYRIESTISAMAIFNRSMQIVRNAIQSVEDLDAAFTQIAIVSEQSSEQAWSMFDSFNKLAKQYSITTKDLAEGAKLFYQQGLNAADTMKMVEASTVSAALGEVTMTEAANTLTAAIQGYNESAAVAMDYTDKIAMVGAVSAADFNELSLAMEKTASSAYTAGIDFDHLLGYLGKMIEVTREAPANLGTAMKTIIARFEDMKKDPMAILEDGVSANKVEAALATIGIALRDSEGEFRALQDVMDELGIKWESLTRNQQAYIATVAAGSRQQSRFLAMMNNYDRTLDLITESQNSAGAAAQQYAIYQDSVAAAQARLTASWEKFYSKIVDNGLIKTAINGMATLVDTLSHVPPIITAIGAAIGALQLQRLFELFRGGKGAAKISDMTKPFKDLYIASKDTGKSFSELVKMSPRLSDGFKSIKINLTGLKDNFISGARAVVSFVGANWQWIAAAAAITAAIVLVNHALDAQKRAYEENINKIKEYQEEANNLQTKTTNAESLIESYEQLVSKVNRTAEEQTELNNIIEQIAQIYPQAVEWVDEYGNKHLENIEYLKEEIEYEKELAKDRTKSALQQRKNLLNNTNRSQWKKEDFEAINFGGREVNRYFDNKERLKFYENINLDSWTLGDSRKALERAKSNLENYQKFQEVDEYRIRAIRQINSLIKDQNLEYDELNETTSTYVDINKRIEDLTKFYERVPGEIKRIKKEQNNLVKSMKKENSIELSFLDVEFSSGKGTATAQKMVASELKTFLSSLSNEAYAELEKFFNGKSLSVILQEMIDNITPENGFRAKELADKLTEGIITPEEMEEFYKLLGLEAGQGFAEGLEEALANKQKEIHNNLVESVSKAYGVEKDTAQYNYLNNLGDNTLTSMGKLKEAGYDVSMLNAQWLAPIYEGVENLVDKSIKDGTLVGLEDGINTFITNSQYPEYLSNEVKQIVKGGIDKAVEGASDRLIGELQEGMNSLSGVLGKDYSKTDVTGAMDYAALFGNDFLDHITSDENGNLILDTYAQIKASESDILKIREAQENKLKELNEAYEAENDKTSEQARKLKKEIEALETIFEIIKNTKKEYGLTIDIIEDLNRAIKDFAEEMNSAGKSAKNNANALQVSSDAGKTYKEITETVKELEKQMKEIGSVSRETMDQLTAHGSAYQDFFRIDQGQIYFELNGVVEGYANASEAVKDIARKQQQFQLDMKAEELESEAKFAESKADAYDKMAQILEGYYYQMTQMGHTYTDDQKEEIKTQAINQLNGQMTAISNAEKLWNDETRMAEEAYKQMAQMDATFWEHLGDKNLASLVLGIRKNINKQAELSELTGLLNSGDFNKIKETAQSYRNAAKGLREYASSLREAKERLQIIDPTIYDDLADKMEAAGKAGSDAMKKIGDLALKAAEAIEKLENLVKELKENLKDINVDYNPFLDLFEAWEHEWDYYYNIKRLIAEIGQQGEFIDNIISADYTTADEKVQAYQAKVGNITAKMSANDAYLLALRAGMAQTGRELMEEYGEYYKVDPETGQVYQTDKNLTQINDTINSRRREIYELQKTQNEKENDLALEQSKLDALEEEKSAYESILSEIESQIDSYKNLDDIVADISELESQREAIKVDIEVSDKSIREQKDKIQAMEDNLQEIKVQIELDEQGLKKLEDYPEKMADKLSEYEEYWDKINEEVLEQQELLQELAEIQNYYIDTAISTEQELYNAIVENYQKEIDQKKKQYDYLKQLDNDYLASIKDNINKERKAREDAQNQKSYQQNIQRLQLLQQDTSGAYRNEIAQLGQEIEGQRQDLYDDLVDKQVEALEKEIEKRHELYDKEVAALEERLAYMQENAILLWEMVNEIVADGSEEMMALLENTTEYINSNELNREKQRKQWEQNIKITYKGVVDSEIENIGKRIEKGKEYIDSLKEIKVAIEKNIETYTNSTEILIENDENFQSAMDAFMTEWNTMTSDMTGYHKDWKDNVNALKIALEADIKAIANMNNTGGSIKNLDDALRKTAQEMYNDFLAERTRYKNELTQLIQQIQQQISGAVGNAASAIRGAAASAQYVPPSTPTSTPTSIPTSTPTSTPTSGSTEPKKRWKAEIWEYDNYYAYMQGRGKFYSSKGGYNSEADAIAAADAEIAILKKNNAPKWYGRGKTESYKKGGLANFTGPAWLDGSLSEPERILSPRQTKLFESMVHSLEKSTNSNVNSSFGSSYNIGDINTTIQVQKLDNETDVNKLVKQVEEKIVKSIRNRVVVSV